MKPRNKAVLSALLSVVLAAASMVAIGVALAHGSMQTPLSRSYGCFLEGPEAPRSAACQAAVALGGTQPLYDWNEINIGDAAGRHREIIPDGKLCSAGRDKYKGFDLGRTDWPATVLVAGSGHTFRYKATAPHRGTFELYVTVNGYNPAVPLRWSDLEATPFLRVTNPPLIDGAYVMDGLLPSGKSGRHVIYAIWQRSDSPEAFYSCSDVSFGISTAPTNTPVPTATATRIPTGTAMPPTATKPAATNTPIAATPTATRPAATSTSVPPTATKAPTATPTAGSVAAWAPNVAYSVNQLVTYGGHTYKCIQAHTSQTGWEPPNVPALWGLVN